MSELTDDGLFDRLTERYAEVAAHDLSGLLVGGAAFLLIALLPWLIELSVLGLSIDRFLSLKVLIITLIFAYSAQAWNIMSGFTGQFSFGHAAYFGIGAYATQALLVEFQVNPWVGLLLGASVAALYGLMVSVLSFRYRLKGHYFALATLAFAELLRVGVRNMGELHGANGYYKPLPDAYASGPGLVAFQFEQEVSYFFVILAFLVLITLLSWAISRSWIGLYFFSIRADEHAARSVGVPVFRYKVIGVMVSAFFTAWAGAFWSMYFNTIRPGTVFDLFKNVEILLPAIVGGPGTIAGPILGSFIVTPISELARTTFSDINGLDRIIYGVFLVAIVLFSPQGIISWPEKLRALWQRIDRRPTAGGQGGADE